jgi:hypothetical protein
MPVIPTRKDYIGHALLSRSRDEGFEDFLDRIGAVAQIYENSEGYSVIAITAFSGSDVVVFYKETE